MRRIVVFGNSGSGKTTLARVLTSRYGLAHLDLDLLAWDSPGVRRSSTESAREPEKYPSKEAQDQKLKFLLDWVRKYESRTDQYSLARHRELFEGFRGPKAELSSLPD